MFRVHIADILQQFMPQGSASNRILPLNIFIQFLEVCEILSNFKSKATFNVQFDRTWIFGFEETRNFFNPELDQIKDI